MEVFSLDLYNLMYNTVVKSLNVSEFRVQCLAVLDRLPPEGITITKRGKAIARVVPIRTGKDMIGSLIGRLQISGDVLSTGERWDAES